jgi:tetratricopeptide (TPR) repeat protein
MTRPAAKAGRAPTAPSALHRRAVWIIGLIAVLAIAAALMWRRSPAIPRPDLAGADEELVEAIDTAEQQIRRQPRSAAAWGDLGLVLRSHGYRNEAATCFERAGELDPQEWRWPYFQGDCEQWNLPEKAIESLRTAVGRDQTAEAPRVLLGELLLLVGNAANAQAELEAVLDVNPRQARAQVGLARALLDQEQFAESLAAVQKAADHRSTRRAAAELRAQILQRLNQPAAAREAQAAAQKLPPDLPWTDDPLLAGIATQRVGKQAALNRVAKLQAAGEIDQAKQEVQAAEQKHLDLYWLVEGRLRLRQGDASGAETALQEALALDPSSVEILLSLAQAQSKQQRWQDAEQTLRDLLTREPEYGPGWLELGRCLTRSNPPQALEALRSAVRYMPRSAEAHQELAAALAATDLQDEAEQHRAIAAKLNHQEAMPHQP